MYKTSSTAENLPVDGAHQISRIIWTLWFQGWDSAPEIVKACLRTWRNCNEGWDIRALCMTDAEDLLKDDYLLSVVASRNLPLTALSDVMRVALLRKYGGVWIDSTCYCLMPLDKWLPSNVGSGFFAFDKPRPDRMVSSWFLAAADSNYIIDKWYDLTADYWRSHRVRDDYFWFHRLFGAGYSTNPKFRAIWDSTPKLPADGPHYYVPYEETLHRPATHDDRELLDHSRIPLLKLTHKMPKTIQPKNSVFNYLVERAFTDGNVS